MGTIIAIGGGEVSQKETLVIDRTIVNFIKKEHPRVLFIPTASCDSEEYWIAFKKVYDELSCFTDVLWSIREKLSDEAVQKKFEWADVIYVGGGNTLLLMNFLKKPIVNSCILNAWKKGVVLAGLSAGAMCWFEQGISDAVPNTFIPINGLGLISGTCCVDYSRKERKDACRTLFPIINKPLVGIDKNTALVIQDERYSYIRTGTGRAYVVTIVGQIIKEENVQEIQLVTMSDTEKISRD